MAFGEHIRRCFWLGLVIPVSAALCFYWRMPWVFVIGAAVGQPLLDTLIGAEKPSSEPEFSLGPRMPAYFNLLWWSALAVAALHARSAGPLELAGLTVACGILGAMAMAHTHELIHRDCIPGRTISTVALILAGYPHYRTVHRLHHQYVGDPAYGSTAAVGESLWRHVPKSLMTSIRESLLFEARRSGSLLLNRFTAPVLACVVLLVAAYAWGGTREAIFWVGSFALCIFLVEGIGYLQHYGLGQKEGEALHVMAWDMEYWLSNRLFVNNGRHTHHHVEQSLNYSLLQPGKATLPGGYFVMLWAAFFPKLWFSIMDSRVAAVRVRETSVVD
ncbi:fatty acid desaturase [Paraburkholderia sp. EG287A]|uniref:fatty acid desaturase n=1 Tax=Paraburkholderia sp. EG287A TaxID=3237012 RepID=UPI0034D33644